MIEYSEIEGAAVKPIYTAAEKAMMELGASRGEAVAASLVIIGLQYTQGDLDGTKLAQFMKDATEWLSMYFDQPEITH